MLATLQGIGDTILLNKVMNYTKLHQNKNKNSYHTE
jgi:hypothetical protein